ncbi:la-related protein 1B-like isoform X1 [Salvia miltiorrhiza]|uniref:la-related protein 1B-like isoform X1 n=1 Tax=Salvia miltiorrhiza TaxID=226208 RepID=UPI0025AC938B|nr:la-related protein 1B-like isoform X1 [Salvia miltiorrhiza]
MATASDASSAPIQAQNSPRGRQSRRSSAARGVPSPSASPPSLPISGIVDQEQFLTSSSSTSSDSLPIKEANSVGDDGLAAAAGEDFQLENGENGAAGKKPVWNKPSNGAAAEAAGAVMGAESWPALAESARASPKSPSTYSLKPISHGSISISQEDLTGGSLSSPKEVSSSISSPNAVSNHVISSRPKRESIKRSSGSSSSPHMPATDNFSQAPLVQHGTVVDSPTHSTGKLSAGEPSRDSNTTNKEGGQRGASYSANETQPQRSFRRNNSGPLTRGDGSYHHGGRRDQERGGKQDWGHRSFNHRESHGSQQRTGSRPFLRGPAPNAPFVPPPPVAVRPFVAPVVYTEMQSPVFYVPGPHPDSLRPMSMVPMPSMFFSMHDPHLPSKIVNQIDYYFSNENLVKDIFLRQNMDGEGWVSIKLIAGFKKVMQLTDNIQLILDVIKSSNAVEVQGDKVRRKGDWMKWIMSPTQTTVMSPQSSNRSSPNMLAAHLNSVTLDEKAAT